ADFLLYCRKHSEDEWFDIAVNHNTLAINKLLDAIYQKNNPKNKTKNVSLDEKVSQAKEMKNQGVKLAVIADTLGISRATLYRYLNK
nr:Hin recombinase [Enterococcus sp.]